MLKMFLIFMTLSIECGPSTMLARRNKNLNSNNNLEVIKNVSRQLFHPIRNSSHTKAFVLNF